MKAAVGTAFAGWVLGTIPVVMVWASAAGPSGWYSQHTDLWAAVWGMDAWALFVVIVVSLAAFLMSE